MMNLKTIIIISAVLIICVQLGCLKKETTMNPKIHHYLGIEMNQQTWTLLEKNNRDENDDIRMMYFAKASKYHWKRSSQFQEINEQRGDWLISHVYAVLGDGELALKYASTCLKLTKKNDYKGFDLAYAYEGLARAYAILKQTKNMEKYFNLAKEAGNDIESEEDKKYFFSDLHSGPWFECLKK